MATFSVLATRLGRGLFAAALIACGAEKPAASSAAKLPSVTDAGVSGSSRPERQRPNAPADGGSAYGTPCASDWECPGGYVCVCPDVGCTVKWIISEGSGPTKNICVSTGSLAVPMGPNGKN